MLPTRFHVPRRTQDPARIRWNFVYRVCTFFDWPINAIRLSLLFPRCSPTTPVLRLVRALPISLATTFGITVVFFSSRYLDVSIPWVLLSQVMYWLEDSTTLLVLGCPIRIPPDRCLFTTPRGISLLIASFFRSICQDIHHTLFFV